MSMSYSTKDELAEIERSARRAESPVSDDNSSVGARRGSSMFGVTMSSDDDEKKYVGDDLLVDFPDSDDDSDDEATPQTERPPTSGMKRGIEDFGENQRELKLPGAPMPGATAPKAPSAGTSATPVTGSQNHRPMVGGFAAAAYEAAREYHYQSRAIQKKHQDMPKRTGPPPSI